MLIVTRKKGEAILIGTKIRVTVANVDGAGVRLGAEVPDDVSVNQLELIRPAGDESSQGILNISLEFQFET
jgi:carbon storage regulator